MNSDKEHKFWMKVGFGLFCVLFLATVVGGIHHLLLPYAWWRAGLIVVLWVVAVLSAASAVITWREIVIWSEENGD